MDSFLQTIEARRSEFEGAIFMQEPYNGLNAYKNYSVVAVSKYPSIVYADFHMETYKRYKSLTNSFNLSKFKE